ncbi:MAG: GNAT family N-acetyltransferase [Maribacter sp.]|nr:GNAT family N-acetyltransferase [Maribacter sp.]
MPFDIIAFEPRYAKPFKDLNKAWLEKYFYIEPKDIVLLEDCQKSILDPGGFIFFARFDGEIAGCFALIYHNTKVYELGKMAVEEKFQGKKIGQKLLTHAIDFARSNDWHKLVLYSSTKLPAALHIYRKNGFLEVPLEKDNPYIRSDIKMELLLN